MKRSLLMKNFQSLKIKYRNKLNHLKWWVMNEQLKNNIKIKLKYQKIDWINFIKNLINKAQKIYLTKINQMLQSQRN